MKKIKNNWLWYIIVIFVSIYLIVDIVHFMLFRLNPVYPALSSAYYESHLISVIKWALGLLAIIGFFFDKKDIQFSIYIISASAIGILVLFILKGQLLYLFKGSIVYHLGILEISSVLMLIYSGFNQKKKYEIKLFKLILFLIFIGLIFGAFFYQLPIYKMIDQIS